MKTFSVIAVAVMTMVTSATAQTIGIDVGDGVWDDGGEDNANGLQITATSFGSIATGGGEKTVTVDGITFTLNPGGAQVVGAWQDRSEILGSVNPGRYTGPVPWKFEGLVPGGLYNVAFLMLNGRPGTWTVDGVGSVTPDADSDSNFEGVAANGLGVISGTWDYWTISAWCSFTALLIEYTGEIAEDTTPPSIASLTPTNNATGFVPENDLIATFDEVVQKGTGNIVIKQDGGSIFETIDVTSGNATVSGMDVTINPASDFSYGVSYYVEIDSGAITDVSLATNEFPGISGDATWSFTTELPDTTAPTYTELSPVNEATDVQLSADLLITFDEDVQKGSGDIVIKETGGSVFETIAVTNANVTISGAVVTINPSSNLDPLTEYDVEIDSGAIKDLGGPTPNDFLGISSSAWRFTTRTLPTVVSIDFDSNNTVQSGEPIHADGPSIPGQEGPWHKLTMKGSGQISTIDTGNGVFTFNTTEAAFAGYGNQEGGLSTPLRGNMFWMNSAGTLTWTLTDLVPGATYNIICYSTYSPAYGGYKLADFAIEGFDDGNVQPQDDGSGEEEGDVDFFGVIADETGKIQGTWSWIRSWAEFGGIQFDKVADPLPAGTIILIK